MIGQTVEIHIGDGYWLTFEVVERLENGRYLLATPLGQEREMSERDLEDYINARD